MILHKTHLNTIAAADSPKGMRKALTYMQVVPDSDKSTITSYAADSYIAIKQVETNYPTTLPEKPVYLDLLAVKKQKLNYGKGHLAELTEGVEDIGTKFPDIEAVIPTTEPEATISVSVELLKKLLAGIEKSKYGSNQVTISFYGQKKPLVFTTTRNNLEFTGLLMPLTPNN